MTRIEISAAAYILVTGCAATSQPATSGLAPVSPAAVQVFLDREPARPYVSIARFTIERADAHANGTSHRLLDDARASAAEMGANAILVTSIPGGLNRTRLAKGSDAGGGIVEEWWEQRAALDVVAVVWACGGGSSSRSRREERQRRGGTLEDAEGPGGKFAP